MSKKRILSNSDELEANPIKKFDWVVVGVTILVMLPMVWRVEIPFGHDVLAHTTRAKLMVEALKEGQFPVRWVGYAFGGAGAPLFNYYQVGFSYAAAALGWVMPLSWAVKLSVVGMVGMGTWGMYRVGARRGKVAAQVMALLFVTSIYLVNDLYVRAAYPEILALGLLPWWWEMVEKNIELGVLGRKLEWKSVAKLALLTGGMLLAHLPTFLIGGVVIGSYVFMVRWKELSDSRVWRRMLVGSGLGIVLAAFYWLPALVELPLIQHEWLSYGAYDYRAHFVAGWQLVRPYWGFGISQAGTNDGMSFFVGGVQLLVTGWLGYQLWRKRVGEHQKIYRWVMLMIWFGVGMMTRVSGALWDGYEWLKLFQYPWRFGMVVMLATGYGGGVMIRQWEGQWQRVGMGWVVVQGLVLIFLSQPQRYVEPRELTINVPWRQGEIHLWDVEEGYLPVGAVATRSAESVVRVVTGEAEVEVTEQRAHDVEFGVTVKERATVEVNRFAMPGWEWRVNGERVGENLTRSNEGKLMHEFDEPGEYRVQVLFGKTRVRWVAEALSVLGLAGVGWWVKSRR